jgi:hypothetical protein
MNANFIDDDQTAKFLMYLTKHFFVAKWVTKAAISRGTLGNMGWFAIPGTHFFTGSASLGSVLSVAAEIMDPKKVEDLNSGIEGKVDGPGDELIYLNRYTDFYLPTTEKAPREAQFTQMKSLLTEEPDVAERDPDDR